MTITIIIDDTPRGGAILLPRDLHHPRDRMRNPKPEPKRMTAAEMAAAIEQASKWAESQAAQPRRRAKQRRGT